MFNLSFQENYIIFLKSSDNVNQLQSSTNGL